MLCCFCPSSSVKTIKSEEHVDWLAQDLRFLFWFNVNLLAAPENVGCSHIRYSCFKLCQSMIAPLPSSPPASFLPRVKCAQIHTQVPDAKATHTYQ